MSLDAYKKTAHLHHIADHNVENEIVFIAYNPCDGAELPKAERHAIAPLTDAEIPLFLAAIDAHPYRNSYALCLFAGLREGGMPGPVMGADRF